MSRQHGAYQDTPAGTYQVLDVAGIEPSPLNRRYEGDDDQRVLALAADIERQGLIHPINVRAMPGGKYEIICGEGRWRAFRRAGLERIPCIVRDCDESAAQVMRLAENLQRHNLDPLDEGEGVRALLRLHNDSADEVAARLKWSPAWVRRRASLANLSLAWREEIANPDTLYDHIRDKVTHLEMIAPLPHETQDALLSSGVLRYKLTARDLRAALALAMRRLDAKPWTREFDKKTYSGSSGRRCDACQKRSGRKDGGLFDELVEASAETVKGDKSDLCLDPACWAEKTFRFVSAQINDNPGVHLIASDLNCDISALKLAYGEILPSWAWEECIEGNENSKSYTEEAKGVFVSGNRIGKVIDIMLRDDREDELDDAERRKRKEVQIREMDERRRLDEERVERIRQAVPESIENLKALLAAPENLDAVLLNWGVWLGLECIRFDDDADSDFLVFATIESTCTAAWESIREDIVRLLAYDKSEAGNTQESKSYFASLFKLHSLLNERDNDAGAPSE